MVRKISILIGIAPILPIPLIFQRREVTLIPSLFSDVIVIIAAHSEMLRSEYGHGFTEWCRTK
jgi:hypothetical protein